MAGKAKGGTETPLVWQDREIKFDQPPDVIKLRRGEFQIDSLNAVEDTKGNNGEPGCMVITNLRVIWIAHKSNKTNLSIGLNNVTSISIKLVASKLKGTTRALYLMAKFNGTHFEFIFTSLVQSPRIFTTIQAVHRAYETTRLYRDLKLRGAIIREKELVLLPHEQIYDKFGGVWNLSSDQGNLGVLYITNVRVVWFAVLAENFNVSIPYMQIKTADVRNSKFGQALVLETSKASGAYVLGFRVDPPDALERIQKQIAGLHKVFGTNPVFGIDFSVEEKTALADVTVPKKEDDVQIVDSSEIPDIEPSILYAAQGTAHDREPVYNAELGLAVEKLKEGTTIQGLWSIL